MINNNYGSLIEKIVKIEETNRQRCGYLYEITINSNNIKQDSKDNSDNEEFQNIKQKTLYVDLNHKFKLENGKIKFEKNKKPCSGEDWGYNKDPFEIVAISIMPQCPENSAYIKMFNSLYKEQEDLWRANYNKEEHNDCVAHKQNLILENKNLLL